MRVIDALSIEGKPNFGVLCYGIFSLTNLDAAHQALMPIERQTSSKVHKFKVDYWPNGLLLIEVTVTDEGQVTSAILSAFSKLFDAGPCLSAVCMYDGAFGSYEDIFSDSVADQTYAFCFIKNQHVVNLDSISLSSKEWASIIALSRKRLG